MTYRRYHAIAAAIVLLVCGARVAAAQRKPAPPPSDNYDEIFNRYLAQARVETVPPAGTDWNWMNGLSLDLRARRVNDLVTIRVMESITAAGSADSALTKDSKGGLSVTNFFGGEKKVSSLMDPSSLVAGKSATDFKGSGTTSRAGELTALVTARVASVLPSGDLVIEGVREIEINGDRQIVVLTGVVRVADISPSNVVASPSIGQLRIRYFGRGLMKDNLNPGWFVRILNRIF